MESGQDLKFPKSKLREFEENLRLEAKVEGLKIDIKVKDNGDNTVNISWTVSEGTVPATSTRAGGSERGEGVTAAAPTDLPSSATSSSAATAKITTEETAMTSDQLKKIFPNAQDALLKQVADELNTAPARYGLDTRLRQAHFFAQVRQESGAGFDAQVESLNYLPAALQSTFGYYGSHKAEAEADGRLVDKVTRKILRPANQQVIANKVYANRIGNGDIASGDGWNYRGRGLLQVTGRSNYDAITKTYRQLYPGDSADFVASPALMESFPYTVRAAVCYWIKNGLDKKADLGSTEEDVDRITGVINLHTESYGERRANFKLAFGALK